MNGTGNGKDGNGGKNDNDGNDGISGNERKRGSGADTRTKSALRQPRSLRLKPICQVTALMMVAGWAHAAANLGHVSASSSGSSIPGVAMPGLGNLSAQQPQVAQQTVANLGHIAAALSAQLAAQQQAAAAVAGTTSAVPNGLAKGGLQVLSGGTWSNAGAPTQAVAGGQSVVTVQQSAPQALLDWQSFNVGRQTTLNFDQQGNSSWVVMNRVNDPSGVPSQILGQIVAPGQVYVINHNGVIFGAGSQVSTGSLIASTATLDAAAFNTTGIYSTDANGVYVPSFTNAGGAIVVEPGALISTNTPSSITAGGGYVMLLGSSVSNQGAISTPDGQTALAAGDNFLTRPGYGTQGTVPSQTDQSALGNSWSTTRGNEIAVQITAGSGSGTVSNRGIIDSSTGDISLIGHQVTQAGVALSTTSVNTRGTIHLLNSASDSTGSVTLTPNSVTAILPDSSTATALPAQQQALLSDSVTQNGYRLSDTAITGQFDDLSLLNDLEDQSRIEIVSGGTAEFQNASLTMAQGGQIAVSATQRVQVDAGANLDVSGMQALLPMSANALAVSIEGNEQRDAPVNRVSGVLNNDDVMVDIQDLIYVPAGTDGYASARYYTPGGLLEVSGELGNVAQSIQQWEAAGGSITLATGNNGAVVVQSGAVFNLSGGALQYQAGQIAQSWLLGADGNIYNVNNAPAGVAYTGIYQGFVESHPHWGITKNWLNPLLAPSAVNEAAYTVGANAGSLTFLSPTTLFAGTIDDATEVSQAQDKTAAQDPNPTAQDVVPSGGTLTQAGSQVAELISAPFVSNVTFANGGSAPADSIGAATPIAAQQSNTVWFDAGALSRFGLSGITVSTLGSVALEGPLTLAPGGALTIYSSTVEIGANLTTHGGAVNLTTNGAGATPNVPSPPHDVDVVVEPNVTLDLTGLWSNAALDPTHLASQAFANGGNLTIKAQDGITLAPGSLIDASAGGYQSATNTTTIGNGGNISLLADQTDFSPTSAIGETAVANLAATLTLDGTIRSYGVKGGTLTLTFPQGLLVADNPLPYGTSVPAGTTTTVDLTLAQPLTIKAGQALPFGYASDAQTLTHNLSAAPGSTLQNPLIIYSGLTFAADWVDQSEFGFYVSVAGGPSMFITPGTVVPAGAVVTDPANDSFPPGMVIPANVFPQGLITGSYQTAVVQAMPAGTIATSDVTFAAGTRVPAGTTLAQSIDVESLLTLAPSFFQQGFSAYNITNLGAIDIAPGTSIDVTEPVYQANALTAAQPTGARPQDVFSVVLPPLYLANGAKPALTQRQGASLSLSTLSSSAVTESTVIYDGAMAGATALPVTITSALSPDLTLLANWMVPDDDFYQNRGGEWALAPGTTDPNNAMQYSVGQTIPAGATLLIDEYGDALEGTDSNPAATPVPVRVALPPTFAYHSPSLLLGQGASISVDPNQSVTLASPGQVTIDGDITAHAGAISIYNTLPVQLGQGAIPTGQTGINTDPNGLSIWIGGTSTLDVSGQVVSATDLAGEPYGSVSAGGAVLLGNAPGNIGQYQTGPGSTPAFVIVRPGAVLDADGAAAALDPFPSNLGTSASSNLAPLGSPQTGLQTVASNGGAITLTSETGIYNDGSMTAQAGGAGAAGGSLSVRAAAPIFDFNVAPPPIADEPTRYLSVGQAAQASGLPAALQPGLNDPSLIVGQSYVSVAQIEAGGFGNVTLDGDDGVGFAGNVSLATNQSLTLVAGKIFDTQNGATVKLSAPYIMFNSPALTLSGNNEFPPLGTIPVPIAQAAQFDADATGLMDIYNALTFNGFGVAALASAGDLRLIGTNPGLTYRGSLTADGDLSLSAARVYGIGGLYPNPNVSTGVLQVSPSYTIQATGTLSIHNAGATADTTVPETAMGSITLQAATIDQGGALFAPMSNITFDAGAVDLQPGSLTSTSSAGLVLPWGGTNDGITYLVDGQTFAPQISDNQAAVTSIGNISFNNQSLDFAVKVEKGAVIDVSGGGTIQGKTFVSGEQGSVDALLYPFLTFNPKSGFNANAANQVFAIMVGAQPGYATPINSMTADGSIDPTPGVGAQITIPAGVPGLPAGTYTLLPSNYALLPGGFRVELQGNAQGVAAGATPLSNGTYLVDGYQGVANTSVRNALATQIAVTPGATVLNYSQYNQTTYSQSVSNYLADLGPILSASALTTPWIPADAGSFSININDDGGGVAPPDLSFTFDGTGVFTAGQGGLPGQAAINLNNLSFDPDEIDIVGAQATPQVGHIELHDADLARIGAPTLIITNNNSAPLQPGVINDAITVDAGATLTGSTLILQTDNAPITVASGGAIEASNTIALLAVSTIAPDPTDPSPNLNVIDLQADSTVASQGSLILATPDLDIDPAARVGAVSLNLAAAQINIGTAASLSAAGTAGQLPAGLSFTQQELNTLLNGNAQYGLPQMQQLILQASGSINLIGSATLDATHVNTLEIDTPAIYGLGKTSDVAGISADTLIWNTVFGTVNNADFTVASAAPITANGPGTGTGTLNLTARQVIMGSATPGSADYPEGFFSNSGGVNSIFLNALDPQLGPVEQATQVDRVTSGFATVNLTGTDSITSNSHGALTVSQADGSAADLHLSTPLLSGVAGSVESYSASGALTLAAPAGAAPSTATPTSLGAEIDLSGASVTLDSTIVANSGVVHVNAAGDIALGALAYIDLAGQSTVMNDVIEYSWGGDLDLESGNGNITQAVGSSIDVSALDNAAGSITVKAIGSAGGTVTLDGTLLGASTVSQGATQAYTAGSFDVAAQKLGAADLNTGFAALNSALDTGGFFGARLFDLKQDNLTINGTVKAADVEISLDDGSLTVGGLIDASGPTPGTIRLSAHDNLELLSSAVLDAHGTVLQQDSYGNPIDAENRATVELSAVGGKLTLEPNATIDLSSPEATPQGDLELDVGRTAATSGDANIVASMPVTIKGAQTIAVNAFWTYSPTDPNGTIVQDNGSSEPVAGSGADAGFVGLDQINTQNAAYIDAALTNPTLLNDLTGLTAYSQAFHLRPGVQISSAQPNGNLTINGDLDFSGFRYASLNSNSKPSDGVYGSGEPGSIVIRAGGNLSVNGSINDGFAPPPATPDGKLVNTTVTSAAGTELSDTLLLTYSVTLTTDWTVPSDDFYTNQVGGVYDSNFNFYGPGQTIPAGTALLANNAYFEAGIPLPGYSYVQQSIQPTPIWAVAPMLPGGDLSWSMRLVAGADLGAADSRMLQPAAQLGGAGNFTLNNPLQGLTSTDCCGDVGTAAVFSVLRTGTGALDLLAGGDFDEQTPFGIYTAGTQSPAVGSTVPNPIAGSVNAITGAVQPDDVNEFGLPRGVTQDGSGSVLGDWYDTGLNNGTNYPYITAEQAGEYEAAVTSYQAYYPQSGGNLLLHAQGNVSAPAVTTDVYPFSAPHQDVVSNWLWQQGGSAAGEAGAWWINFGTYTNFTFYPGSGPELVGFQGIGTLGGGNATISAGGNIENVLATVGSTGRVTAVTQSGSVITGGTIDETGGGRLAITAGGDVGGTLTDTRGAISVAARTIGSDVQYSELTANGYITQTVAPYPYTSGIVDAEGNVDSAALEGLDLVQGDAAATLDARGDLFLTSFGDAGMVFKDPAANWTNATFTAGSEAGQSGSAVSWFSLYTAATAATLDSVGGALNIGSGARLDNQNVIHPEQNALTAAMLPPTVIAVANSGSIDLSGAQDSMELAPSAHGELELLAQASVTGVGIGATPTGPGQIIGMSGANADPNDYANPFRPSVDLLATLNFDIGNGIGAGYSPFTYETDLPTTELHNGDTDPIRIYALSGDIVGLGINDMAKAAQIEAGGSISYLTGQLSNVNAGDISLISAGGNIIYPAVGIAGPGRLVVQAGDNIFMGGSDTAVQVDPRLYVSIFGFNTGQSSFTSTGLWYGQTGSVSGGAGITVLAGLGANQPDYADFANAYLNPADPSDFIASGMRDYPQLVQQNDQQLATWLLQTAGYQASDASDAWAHFQALPAAQRDIFLRQLFFAQLDLGGLEFNDPTSIHYKSYIAGRDAIALLFPSSTPSGQPIDYAGDITMEGGSGIRTEFGGDIEIFSPGGATTIGIEGPTPPSSAGVITEGAGNIDIYSLDSIELGQSRVLTTFGGDILMWSSTGDINAGKGSKTTIVYSPPLIAYDPYGNITLAPTVPSTGAGIGTLNPVPQVPRGDIDLVAPQGTIDAGEAGIRVSGNLNVAALQIVNAANIQVQGKATGIPVVAAINTGALAAADSASAAVTQVAQNLVRNNANGVVSRHWVITVQVEGFGDAGGDDDSNKKRKATPISYDPLSEVSILGFGRSVGNTQRALLTKEEQGKLGDGQ